MFNRGYFNHGKFNTSSSNLEVTGIAKLSLTSTISASLDISAPQSGAIVQVSAAGTPVRRFCAAANATNLAFGVSAKATRRLFSVALCANTALNLKGTAQKMVFAVASTANLHLYSLGRGKRRFFAGESPAVLRLLTAGNSARKIFAHETASIIKITTTGAGTRRFSAIAESSPLTLNAKGAVTMLGYATIALPGIVIPPAGTLVIDTEQMTVTLNGDDLTRYFSADSEFFKLKPGDNIIVYEDGADSRSVSYKILWKDLWL
jgi:hypothetical protein